MVSDLYAVVITDAAKKRLRRHRHAEAQILRDLATLKSNPQAGHELSGKLRGYRSLKIFVRSSGNTGLSTG